MDIRPKVCQSNYEALYCKLGTLLTAPSTYKTSPKRLLRSDLIAFTCFIAVDVVDPSLPGPTDSMWVLANIQQYGYYRVNYEEDNWKQLVRQLVDDHTVSFSR